MQKLLREAFFCAVVGVVGGKAGREGGRLLGLIGVLSNVLLVVFQTEAVDVAGKRAKAALKSQGDIGATVLAMFHDVVNP